MIYEKAVMIKKKLFHELYIFNILFKTNILKYMKQKMKMESDIFQTVSLHIIHWHGLPDSHKSNQNSVYSQVCDSVVELIYNYGTTFHFFFFTTNKK